MVEGIECFQAQLYISPFAGTDVNVLEQRHIPVLHTWIAQDVTRTTLRDTDVRSHEVSAGVHHVVVRDGSPHIRTVKSSGFEGPSAVQIHGIASLELSHAAQLEVVADYAQPLLSAE